MDTILLRRRTPREFHKDGENYEIGQSKHPGRREYDLAIKLPEEPKLLNKINDYARSSEKVMVAELRQA